MLLFVFGSSGTITCQKLIHSVGTGRTEASSESLRIFTSLFPSQLRATTGDSFVSSSHMSLEILHGCLTINFPFHLLESTSQQKPEER